jgi:Lrp/AsnC family leucine-responsive transcriptional regulator
MIDEIDSQIILLLQEDARLSNGAIAEQIGIPSSTVHDRIKKLERKKVIKKYVAVVDAEKIGKPITAFIRLTVGMTSQGYIASKESVIAVCQNESDVLECHGVAGEDCYILKVRVANPKELEKLIERIRSQAEISRSITSIVLSTFKESLYIKPRYTAEEI